MMKSWVMNYMKSRPNALKFYNGKNTGREQYNKLSWRDYAAIRLLDYIDNAGRKFEDLNLRGDITGSNPIKYIWMAVKFGTGGAETDFFKDMLHLFRQFSGKSKRELPSKEKVLEWMSRHPSGLDPQIIKIRKKNRDRILNVIIRKLDSGEIKSNRYQFVPGMSEEQKFLLTLEWWKDKNFHLKFAIRSPELLNEMLNYSLSQETMKLLYDAKKAGIPFFVNPYYLSFLNICEPEFAPGADLAIRDYIIYSKELINEFGHLVAWEKEDVVEPDKPNIAGWLLPSFYNVHRRYPEVAILIPETIGRACGGLCVSCQRMFDFQSGNLNFNLVELKPKETWPQKLSRLIEYFEEDSQLRDILITGGDALMSSDDSLKILLNEVYKMAVKKIEANKKRANGKKFAEMLRVRLGTRLPIYLPQRITPELVDILAEFKEKASKIGIKHFIIQTHYETAMEVTPESLVAVKRLLSSGWIVTNQLVFTATASRRGHTAKLRKVLNEIGVLPYYTFTVKGYMENFHNFATNERAVQEQIEEKVIGSIPEKYYDTIKEFPLDAENLVKNIKELENKANLPFLATDRNVLNLPGVGKSLTFRTIGITREGRRILEFEHDSTRNHSPIIKKMGKVTIIESKSIGQYLRQLEEMGEDISEYESVYGYSIGETEKVMPIYQYPDYDFEITGELTNFQMDD
jgi:lysine 2,3-aminomutase